MDSRRAVLAVAGFGLAVRAFVLARLSGTPLASDALSYHTMALQLERGESFPPYWPPGLPLYLAPVYRLLGATELAGRASMLLFFLLFAAGIYLLVKKFSSIRSANVAVLVFSLYPTYVHHSVETLTQLPIAAYLVWAAYVTVSLSEGRHRPGRAAVLGAVLGVILGLLILTRASCAVLAVAVPLYVLARTRAVRSAVVPVVVAAAIVFTWVAKVHDMTGRWVFVNEANSMNLFFGNNPYTPLYRTWWFGSHGEGEPGVPAEYTALLMSVKGSPPEVRDRLYLRTALAHVAHRPDLFLIRTANRIRCYFAFDTYTGSYLINRYSAGKAAGLAILLLDALFYCAIMVAAIAALFGVSSRSPWAGWTGLLLLTAGCYALPYWLSFAHPTYHFPVVAIFGVLAARLAGSAAEPAPAKQRSPWTSSAKRKWGFALAIAVFAYIQLEWVWMMRTRI
jgi:4-amino-4-deoxy-L-arabinose transferase-like glycosyltransferase